jgi:hypothetical protein
LAEFRTLTPKMDAADAAATTPEAYLKGTQIGARISIQQSPQR